MAKFLDVEETPLELFSKAEFFIRGIESEIKDSESVEQARINNISFYIMQGIENILKGYIVYNGKTVKQVHPLRGLLEIAGKINKDFIDIEEKADVLDKFKPSIKYNFKELIEIDDVEKSFNILKQIYNNFDIKNIREIYKNVAGYITYEDIEKIKINIKKEETQYMDCVKHTVLNNSSLSDVIKNISTVSPLDDYGTKDLMEKGIFIKKSTYINMQHKDVFVLEKRKNNDNGFTTEVWQFFNDFGKEQALKFIDEWDKSRRCFS